MKTFKQLISEMSQGEKEEIDFVRIISKWKRDLTVQGKSLDLYFIDGEKEVVLKNVQSITRVSRNVKNRKKADIKIYYDNKVIKISIKNESFGSYDQTIHLRANARIKLDEAFKKGLIKLNENKTRLEPNNPVFEIDDTEKQEAVFGTDITPETGFVAIINFDKLGWQDREEGKHKIYAKMFSTLEEIPERYQPYLTVRIASDRDTFYYKGLNLKPMIVPWKKFGEGKLIKFDNES